MIGCISYSSHFVPNGNKGEKLIVKYHTKSCEIERFAKTSGSGVLNSLYDNTTAYFNGGNKIFYLSFVKAPFKEPRGRRLNS